MKSGKYFSSGKNIAYEVERDAALVNRGWSIEWHIDGKALFRYTTKGALKDVNTDCQGRVEKIFRRANSKDIPLVGYHYD